MGGGGRLGQTNRGFRFQTSREFVFLSMGGGKPGHMEGFRGFELGNVFMSRRRGQWGGWALYFLVFCAEVGRDVWFVCYGNRADLFEAVGGICHRMSTRRSAPPDPSLLAPVAREVTDSLFHGASRV